MKKFIFAAVLSLAFCTQSYAGNFKAAHTLTITATTVSTQVLPADKDRNYLIVINQGATTIYVKTGSAHAGTEGVGIPTGGNYEPLVAPNEAIFIRSASATDTVQIIDGN